MNMIQTTPIALPEPRVGITIRAGTMDDVPFMDSMQKKTTKQVGWMPTKQFEGKISLGHVLVAEAVISDQGQGASSRPDSSSLAPGPSVLAPRPVGYLIGNDQYFKRDDVGIIYQINVIPEMRRSLVAASLLKAQFERSAYGCRLYCCWCAQDIEANRFWESMGFVPLAYRAGSEKKARVHIFWQKRIRNGDTSTPWWFPSKTDGGAIRADRIVLPIPPGTHWSDAKPLILPGEASQKELNHEDTKGTKENAKKEKGKKNAFADSSRSSCLRGEKSPARALSGGMSFAPPVVPVVDVPKEKPKREKKPKTKADPRFVAAARELRDRYLDEVNSGRCVVEPTDARYDVSRAIAATPGESMKLLAA